MKNLWLLLPILLLAGCAAPIDYAMVQRHYNIQRCTELADAYNFQGDVRRQAMAQCVMINPGSGMTSLPLYSAVRGMQPGMIGQPDPFGPWSYRGPTWEQFNHFYSQPPPTR